MNEQQKKELARILRCQVAKLTCDGQHLAASKLEEQIGELDKFEKI
jgi:hypothetical protein